MMSPAVVGGGYGLYSGPTVCQRTDHPPDTAAVKSVHFNTVHNCHQLTASDISQPPARGRTTSPLCRVDEGPPTTTGVTGQSLPANYRYRPDPAHSPTATINRHYTAPQPRPLYPPGTVCRRAGQWRRQGVHRVQVHPPR